MGGGGAGTCAPTSPNRKAAGRGPIGGRAAVGAAGATRPERRAVARSALHSARSLSLPAARGALGAVGEGGAAFCGCSRGERREEEAGVQSLAGEGRVGGGWGSQALRAPRWPRADGGPGLGAPGRKRRGGQGDSWAEWGAP